MSDQTPDWRTLLNYPELSNEACTWLDVLQRQGVLHIEYREMPWSQTWDVRLGQSSVLLGEEPAHTEHRLVSDWVTP